MDTTIQQKLDIVRQLNNRTSPRDAEQVKKNTRLLEQIVSDMAPTCSSNPRFVNVKRMLAEVAEMEKLLS